MAIRYNTKINSKLASAVRNFNAKITRLEKVEEELYLPEKVSVSDIKNKATTRKELNKMIRQLRLYSERGMEKTVKIGKAGEMSKYELTKLKRELSSAKAQATRKINEFKSVPIKVFGVPQTTPHEYDEEYIRLKAQREALDKQLKGMTSRDIERLRSQINDILYSERKEQMYKENWLDMLDKLAYWGNIDESKLSKIKERINNLTPANFTKMYRNEKTIKALQERYQLAQSNKFMLDEEFTDDTHEIINNFYNNLDKILEDYES